MQQFEELLMTTVELLMAMEGMVERIMPMRSRCQQACTESHWEQNTQILV
jgi:hypothetical protein